MFALLVQTGTGTGMADSSSSSTSTLADFGLHHLSGIAEHDDEASRAMLAELALEAHQKRSAAEDAQTRRLTHKGSLRGIDTFGGLARAKELVEASTQKKSLASVALATSSAVGAKFELKFQPDATADRIKISATKLSEVNATHWYVELHDRDWPSTKTLRYKVEAASKEENWYSLTFALRPRKPRRRFAWRARAYTKKAGKEEPATAWMPGPAEGPDVDDGWTVVDMGALDRSAWDPVNGDPHLLSYDYQREKTLEWKSVFGR